MDSSAGNVTYIPYRIFEFSSETFGGFQAFVDLRQDQTSEDIVSTAASQLCQSLQKLGMAQLVRKVRRTRFHIHDLDIPSVLTSSVDKIFYICDHC